MHPKHLKSVRRIVFTLATVAGLSASQFGLAAVIFNASYDSSLTPDVAAGSNAVVYSQNVGVTSGGPAVSGESLNATVLPSRLIYNAGANVNVTKGTASFDYNLATKTVGTTYPLDIGSSDLNATGGLMLLLTHGPLTGDPNGPSRWIAKWNGQSLADYFETIPTGTWKSVGVSWDMTGGAGNGIFQLLIDGVVVAQRTDLNPVASLGVPNIYISGSQYGGDSIQGYIDNFMITDQAAIPEPASAGMLALASAAMLRRRR